MPNNCDPDGVCSFAKKKIRPTRRRRTNEREKVFIFINKKETENGELGKEEKLGGNIHVLYINIDVQHNLYPRSIKRKKKNRPQE